MNIRHEDREQRKSEMKIYTDGNADYEAEEEEDEKNGNKFDLNEKKICDITYIKKFANVMHGTFKSNIFFERFIILYFFVYSNSTKNMFQY